MALVFLTVYCKILPFEAFSQHARKHAYVKRSMKRLIFSVLANMQLLKAFLRAFSHKSGSKAPSFSRFFCVLFYVFIRFVGVRRLVQFEGLCSSKACAGLCCLDWAVVGV
jgi:hypothetical protein